MSRTMVTTSCPMMNLVGQTTLRVSPYSRSGRTSKFPRDLLKVLHFAEIVALGAVECDNRLRYFEQTHARQRRLLS